MPEVLTEKERKVKSKCGRFTAPIGCLLCDFTTQASHDAGLNYEEQEEVWSDHSDLVHPLVRIDPERARLEREVIEAVREWRGNFFVRAIYSDLLRGIDRALAAAIDALLQFESQHTDKRERR